MADNKEEFCEGIPNEFVGEILSTKMFNKALDKKPTGLSVFDEQRNQSSQKFYEKSRKEICDLARLEQNKMQTFSHTLVNGVQKTPLVQIHEDNKDKWSTEAIGLFIVVCFALLVATYKLQKNLSRNRVVDN